VPLIAEYRLELFNSIKKSLKDFSKNLSLWLAARAIELFPKSLLENLEINLSKKSQLPGNKNLFSADGWHIIDDWKIYALAQKLTHKTHWIGAPNAVSHGSLAQFWQRNFEFTHIDTYLTWGWQLQYIGANKLVPFYAPHHAGKKQRFFSSRIKSKGILISSAARPKHLLEYPYYPDRFQIYLKNQLKLAQELNEVFHERITIRTRPKDLGWNVKELVNDLKNSDIRIEFQSGRFSDRLLLCRLHICDNCSTTIIESFWANHPTLILITVDYFQLHPEAIDDYVLLAEAGIFHSSLESLIRHCESIREAPETWWMLPQTQEAVQNFLSKQGRLGGGLRVWTHALISPTALHHQGLDI
jgi:putative transferase (TIGR04331 family)